MKPKFHYIPAAAVAHLRASDELLAQAIDRVVAPVEWWRDATGSVSAGNFTDWRAQARWARTPSAFAE